MGNNTPDKPEERGLPADFIKPAIIQAEDDCDVFRAGMDYRKALKRLEKSKGLVVEGSYSTALAFYSWLKKKITTAHPVHDYRSSRTARRIVSEKTGKILVRVKDHVPALEKAPNIPWLHTFYPDDNNFLISLPDLLGMNGAWQWFDKGVSYPVLPRKLHPFYGVYFPSRTSHLAVFDKWLNLNGERFPKGTDIGTGCGILSFMMAGHGIEKIYATDINPNAVYSTRMETGRLNLSNRIGIEQASFFGTLRDVSGLVVLNPPWIPGKPSGITDAGIYYHESFFNRFFSEAEKKLLPGTTLAIIFSSFAIEAGITDHNPVERALSQTGNFITEEKITADVREKIPHKSKNWLNRIREKEKTELWILRRTG